MKALTRLATVAFVVASSLATMLARAEPLPPRARQPFERGTAELETESPDYEEAYRNFKLAYERSRDYRVLASLAHAAEALERDGEAIQAYAEYLALGGDAITNDERGAIERALRALQANAGRVTITSSVPDLAVIDSRVGSEAPPQVYRLEQGRLELELRAGTHLLTATSGSDRLEWQIALAPGSSAEHRFEFVKQQPSDAASSASDPDGAQDSNATLRVVAITAAGIGSAAIVAGAVTGLLVLAKEEDARALCRRGDFGGTECPESARAEFDSASSLATTTNILFVGGGVLTLAGVGAWLLSSTSQKADKSPNVSIIPEISARSTMLSVSGSF